MIISQKNAIMGKSSDKYFNIGSIMCELSVIDGYEDMAHHDVLPLQQGIINRPRVNALIKNGLDSRVLVMFAGPGYGKTQEIAHFLSKIDAKVLWMRLSSFDNVPACFWDHLAYSLSREMPELAERIRELDFPVTPSMFDEFFRAMARIFTDNNQVFWVFDDFGEISSPLVRMFIKRLVESEFDRLRIVIMSNKIDKLDTVVISGGQHLILGKDLRFTKEEIAELYSARGVILGKNELNEIEAYTEGWPLSLSLLIPPGTEIYDRLKINSKLTENVITNIFEKNFFSGYSESLKKLLVKLSMLNSFSKQLACALSVDSPFEVYLLERHAFISSEPAVEKFNLHNMYKLFLHSKMHMLTDAEKLHVWEKAADHYTAEDQTMDAILCFRKYRNIKGMLNAMCDYIKYKHGITSHGFTPETAAFFDDQLNVLTEEEFALNPVADYLRALIFINTMQLDKAEKLLDALIERLLMSGNKEELELLGDTYSIKGAVHMLCGKEDFGYLYEKADKYLPEGTRLQNKKCLLLQNNNYFFMQDSLPGARERMEKVVHYGIPMLSRIFCGSLSGLEHIFSAESSYLSGNFGFAEQCAYRAVYKAKNANQYDIVANAYYILARIGFMKGNFKEISGQIQNIIDYADKYDSGILREIRDTAVGWYYMKMRDTVRVPMNILSADTMDKPLLAYGRTQTVYANYLFNTGEYARIIGLLENPIGLYFNIESSHDNIVRLIMLAIAYLHIGDEKAALKTFFAVYNITYNNKLNTPYIASENHIRELIAVANKHPEFAFDREWLNYIDEEAVAFSALAEKLRYFYEKSNSGKSVNDNPLTKRETEVIIALARGLTREEIAAKQYITVNTVKTFIRSIFNKLNATNRAEAVSIAISRGYISMSL